MTRNYLLLPVALFLIALIAIGRAPFATKGEAREALVVKNMLEQNNFVLPLRNMSEIPSKPPLFHWIGAAASGNQADEFSVRLPSPIFALLALVAFAIVIKRQGIEPIFPLLICASGFEWMRSSQAARVDMAFSSSLTLTLLSMFLLLTTVERQLTQVLLQSLLLLLGFTGAILSKGPAGGVIPIAICGLFYIPELLRTPKRAIFRLLSLVPSLVIGGLLAAWWYLEAYKIGGQKFLDVQLLKENVSRLTGDGKFEVGHEKPFFFGPIELIVAFLPWSLALPLVIRDAYRNRGFKAGSLERFSLTVVTFFVIICSLATSKRPVYFLPVFPFLALLTALSLKRWQKILRTVSIVILVGYSLAAVLIVPHFQNKIGTKEFSASLNQYLEKGEQIYQVANEFYPTLFYLDKGMEKVDSLGQVQSGKLAIIKESDQNPELADLVQLSPGKVDDGKGRLALVRRK